MRVIGLIVVWGLLFAATTPIRQAYINGMIPSRQRATILSFDSLMSLDAAGSGRSRSSGRPRTPTGTRAHYLISAGISAFADSLPAALAAPDGIRPTRVQPAPANPSPGGRLRRAMIFRAPSGHTGMTLNVMS